MGALLSQISAQYEDRMTVCSRLEMIMKEAVKGCITMTSQLSLKLARPKCITVIQDGWDTVFKPVIF
jgi:hypothetical protein